MFFSVDLATPKSYTYGISLSLLYALPISADPAIARVEQLHLAHRIVAADLGDGEAARIFIGQRADAFEEQRDVGVRLVVDFLLEIERPGARLVRWRRGRIVAEFGVVHREIDRIDAEAVDTACEPDANGAER